MTESKSLSLWDLGKVVGISALTIAINYLIRNKKKQTEEIKQEQNQEASPQIKRIMQQIMQITSKRQIQDENDRWGSLKIIPDKKDKLQEELSMMAQIMCSFEKVNNLIVDLELEKVETVPCPLVAYQVKRKKDQPSIDPDSLVTPGEFVIQNCVFRAGQSIECQKKFMRAGPRATQYFDPAKVRADIVVLGKIAPGINNIIRELVNLLKDVYKVQSVRGVKFSYLGYYTDNFVELTSEQVQTIHHHGGSYLGVCKTEFHVEKIVDKLVERGINQMYLIGGNDTLVSAHDIYLEIKKRKLNIALCVCLKAVNKDIAVFDTCFGFESAVEETQRFIEEGYALTKSNYNSVVLIKVPGRYSGFLAMDAARAARNVNICLVPQFSYDLYGERGLLKYIGDRVKVKGCCIIVYSEGASHSVRDIDKNLYAKILRKKQYKEEYAFDMFLKKEIEKELNARKCVPNTVFLFDSQNAVRAVAANSFDTKLCCQIALCSIQGLMCGYTNFAIGHLKNRVAMVPNKNMIQTAEKFSLKATDENWFRLLATTGQSSFKNDSEGEG